MGAYQPDTSTGQPEQQPTGQPQYPLPPPTAQQQVVWQPPYSAQVAPAPAPSATPPPDPATAYKRSLRKTVRKTVLVWGLYFAIVNIVQVILMFVFSFFGTFAAMTQNSQVDLTTLTMDLMANMPFGWILLLSALAGVPAFLLLRGKKMFTEDLVTVNERLNAPSFFAMLAIILGCAGLLQFALILIESVLQLVGLSLPAGGAPSLESIMSPLVILHVMLIAPIFEEIMFRGAILRTLRPYGSNFAIVVSALLFALTHIYLYQATFAFFIGIVLAYCTLRFSIKWAMLLHIVNNSIAMGLTLIDPTGTLTLVSYGVFVVLAIVAGVWGFKKFSQQRRDGKPTEMACVLGIAPNPYVTATPGGSSTGSGGINAGSGPSAHVESAPFPRARPLAIAFSSPWLIAVIALMFCASMLFLVFSPPVF